MCRQGYRLWWLLLLVGLILPACASRPRTITIDRTDVAVNQYAIENAKGEIQVTPWSLSEPPQVTLKVTNHIPLI